MNVIGVDFSGDKRDHKTWVAQWEAHGDNLTLTECRSMSRKQLTRLLADYKEPVIVAMDFPFSVPRSFARCWRPEATEMHHLWKAATDTKLDKFTSRRGRVCAPARS